MGNVEDSLPTEAKGLWLRQPFPVFLLSLLINGLAFALSHNYIDGDPHTRTYMALEWLEDPFFIYVPNAVTWVYAPLHCYLNALVLLLWPDPALSPRLLSLLLTTFTIYPLYHSVRLEFGDQSAFYSAICCCFCTLFIHPAALAVSEGINLVFIFSAIYFTLRFLRSSSWKHVIAAAVLALLATMMRYDSGPIVLTMSVLLLVSAFRDRNSESGPRQKSNIAKALTFAGISLSFALMWVVAQWIELGHPFHMTINSLDVPVIQRHIQSRGLIGQVLYQTAFLPGVLILSIPAPALVSSLVGVWNTIRTKRHSILMWLLAAAILYYFITFVFTMARYPLARFLTIPAALLVCFSGPGTVSLIDKLSLRSRRRVVASCFLLLLAFPIALSPFARPSENYVAEKLRAVSPLTMPPKSYSETLQECRRLLESGERLVVDVRNYFQRLMYLDLYKYASQIDHSWPSADSLGWFIHSTRPRFVLRTDYPRTDTSVFFGASGDMFILAGEQTYRLKHRSGVFAIYERDGT